MPSVSFKFCTAKVAGEGEDADPILRVGPDLGLLGVFDGMGGAGGRVYDTPDGRHTGAWIASRFARNVVERLMLELIKPEWNLDGPATAAELQRVLASSLAARLAELKAPETTLRSRLVKALPTTMTLAVLQRTDPTASARSCCDTRATRRSRGCRWVEARSSRWAATRWRTEPNVLTAACSRTS